MFEFRRGREHIAKANESSKSEGSFRPFLSSFYWKEDGHTKYLWILNPIDDIPMVTMQKVWTEDERVEYTVARTDEAIGERDDPIEDKWGYGPQDLNVCVAVELEPLITMINGRQRPAGFEVKTRTFERRIRNAQGELTEEREDVTTPVVGMIAQSPNNFFNHLSSDDTHVAPVHEKATRITREGTDKNTDYKTEVFAEKDLDMTNLLEFVDGINYLDDEMNDLITQLDQLEDPIEQSILIGETLLNKRLNEMAGEEYYNEVFSKINAPARFPSKKYKEAQGKGGEETPKTERPRRASQRRSAPVEVTQSGADNAEEPIADEAPKSQRSRTSRPEVTRGSGVRERLNHMRADKDKTPA